MPAVSGNSGGSAVAPTVMGVDLGTGGVRAIVIDAHTGALLSSATAEYPLLTPKPQWAEQNPDDWWRASQHAIREALHRAGDRASHLVALGLTGQMHGLTLLDADNQPLRPAILWCDNRTAAQCEQIHETIGLPRLREIAANPAQTGFQAPKLLWVRQHEPDLYRRARHALLPKDFLRLMLSGEYASDVADSSGTLLLDVRRRTWSGELIERLELDPTWLPTLHEGPEVCARVSASGASATGLPQGLPIVAGGGDQAAGGVGNGIVTPGGPTSCTIGTSGVLFAATAEVQSDNKGALNSFCHSVPGLWHVMGVTQAAGLSLRWLRDHLSPASETVRPEPVEGPAGTSQPEASARGTQTNADPYDLLVDLASHAPAGSEGLLFLPYLMGERTPHLDPNARGGWIGLTARHDRAALIRSVLEGVTYSLRDSLTLFHEAGVPVSEIRASGGGARSPLWRQIQADVFGLPVTTLSATDGPAFGAALLATVGARIHPDVPSACATTLQERAPLHPNPTNHATYNHYYSVYRSLYPALKDSFAELSRLASDTVS